MQQIKMEFSEQGENGFGAAVVINGQAGKPIAVREIESKMQRFLLSAGFPVTRVQITLAEVPPNE